MERILRSTAPAPCCSLYQPTHRTLPERDQGRVRTLLIDADIVLPGRLDRSTGEIVTNVGTDAGVDDLLDDIAEEVVARGGEVVVVPTDKMPSHTGLAAIYGY
jgi:hypothetical protein